MFLKKNILSILFLLWSLTSFATDSPMRFIENKGQWENSIQYNSRLNFGNIYFENNAFAIVLQHFFDDEHLHHENTEIPDSGHYYRMEFLNANPNVYFTNSGKSTYYLNYFLGNDATKWKSNVHDYQSITYRNLYQNIDLNVKGNGDKVKYTYYVKPHANVSDIKVNYNGVDDLKIIDGTLHYTTAYSPIIEESPYAYQIIKGKRKIIPCRYALNKLNEVYYVFPKGYNKNYELVIDPNIVFARLSNSTSDNFGFTATFDQAGNSYTGGIVFGQSGSYPTSTGAFDVSYNGGTNTSLNMEAIDIGISCYNGTNGSLIYGTYLGGNDNELPNSIIVNNQNELVILSTTGSSNFPTTNSSYNTTFNGGTLLNLQTNGVYFPGGCDIAVSKLNSTGSLLLGSTFIGGSGNDGINEDANTASIYNRTDLNFNYGDAFRGEVIVDSTDNIYVTSSTNSTNFPTLGTSTSLQGEQDAIVFKLNTDLSTLLFSRYLGGSDDDAGYSMKIDNSGNLFVDGGTKSTDFPTTSNTLHPSFRGGDADGFLVKMNSSNGVIIRSTFIGTPQYDQVYFVDLDDNDNVYIVGHTLGNYLVNNTSYFVNNGKQFIHKLDNNLSSTIYSTKFGTGSNLVDLSLTAFLVDECERVYVSGWGGNVGSNRNPNYLNNSMTGLPLSSDALQSTTDGSDFYFFVLDKNASGQLYGSYFGRSGTGEHVDGGTSRFDRRGTIHQAICAACGGNGTFPSTNGYSSTSSSSNCNLGLVKLALDLPLTDVNIDAFPRAVGCVPLTVNFESLLQDVEIFEWDFGDGSTTNNMPNPIHTYTDTGTYQVQLIGTDPNSCNISDTANLEVWVRNDTIEANKIDTLNVDCETLEIYVGTKLGPNTHTYNWIMGDGTVYTNHANFVEHQYDTSGVYMVVLNTMDTTKCNIEIFDTIVLDFPPNVEADIGTNAGCINTALTMVNYSNPNAETFYWDLGNGTYSNEFQPSTIYTAGGDYTIYLTVIDSGTCNVTASDSNIISIIPPPVANFKTDSNYYLYPDSVVFTNYSYNYTSFVWKFGDGVTDSTTVAPTHFYTSLYEFSPCLEVENEGCRDTLCQDIFIDFIPLIGVPNAFSPNGDGHNDRVKVEGYGITKLKFTIYNRWGEIVYEGVDQDEGWDGIYKGVRQEMEVYTYVVNALLLDNSQVVLKGNISLLR